MYFKIFAVRYYRLLIVIVLFCCRNLLAAQERVIRGTVIDAATGKIIARSSVYINNSTIGTVTNDQGTFILQNVPQQTFDLVCSSVGYESIIIQITDNNRIEPISFKLKQRVHELETVIVRSPENDGWKKYGATFLETIFSYSSFSTECKLLNPSVVKFSYNQKENILFAWAIEPLKIKNNALGYNIAYWLSEFRINYSTKITFIQGTSQFTEQKGSERKKKRWDENRKLAYEGSFNHFVKSLYYDRTTEEDFVINLIKKINITDTSLFLPAEESRIGYDDMPALAKQIGKIYAGRADSLQAINVALQIRGWAMEDTAKKPLSFTLQDSMGYNRFFFYKDSANQQLIINRFNVKDSASLEKIEWRPSSVIYGEDSKRRLNALRSTGVFMSRNRSFDILFTVPLNPLQFVLVENGHKQLLFSDYWQVTYIKESKELAYLNRSFLQREAKGPQQSIMHMPDQTAITLLPDGNYFDAHNILLQGYWAFEKLDKLLPLDYIMFQ